MYPETSILIPVYNREKFIAECIRSALGQVNSDFEVVVVDNASEDGTWEICREIARSDRRIRIFRNAENIGPVRNWARCALEARGRFSKLLFSDDLLEPTCLDRMVPKLRDGRVGLVYCAARIGSSKDSARVCYSLGSELEISASEFLTFILRGKAPVSPGAALLRTKDLRANLWEDFPTATRRPYCAHGAGPDVVISLLAAESYGRVFHVPDPLVFFRSHSDSFTIRNTASQVSLAYRSVLSWYLKEKVGRTAWLNYVASGWLVTMRTNRNFIDPRTYLLEFEGRGSSWEQISMIWRALLVVFFRVLRGLSRHPGGA